jgi:hypothetical protein
MNVSSRLRYVVAGMLAVALAACGSPEVDRSPVTIRIVGDSVFQMVDQGINVECNVPFQAEVEGPDGAYGVMRAARIQYWWWTSGVEAGSYQFSQPQLAQLWVDSVFPVGTPRRSYPHGFGQSTPAQPVRGEAVFEYGASNTDETRQTEAFRFYCY